MSVNTSEKPKYMTHIYFHKKHNSKVFLYFYFRKMWDLYELIIYRYTFPDNVCALQKIENRRILPILRINVDNYLYTWFEN